MVVTAAVYGPKLKGKRRLLIRPRVTNTVITELCNVSLLYHSKHAKPNMEIVFDCTRETQDAYGRRLGVVANMGAKRNKPKQKKRKRKRKDY